MRKLGSVIVGVLLLVGLITTSVYAIRPSIDVNRWMCGIERWNYGISGDKAYRAEGVVRNGLDAGGYNEFTFTALDINGVFRARTPWGVAWPGSTTWMYTPTVVAPSSGVQAKGEIWGKFGTGGTSETLYTWYVNY